VSDAGLFEDFAEGCLIGLFARVHQPLGQGKDDFSGHSALSRRGFGPFPSEVQWPRCAIAGHAPEHHAARRKLAYHALTNYRNNSSSSFRGLPRPASPFSDRSTIARLVRLRSRAVEGFSPSHSVRPTFKLRTSANYAQRQAFRHLRQSRGGFRDNKVTKVTLKWSAPLPLEMASY